MKRRTLRIIRPNASDEEFLETTVEGLAELVISLSRPDRTGMPALRSGERIVGLNTDSHELQHRAIWLDKAFEWEIVNYNNIQYLVARKPQ